MSSNIKEGSQRDNNDDSTRAPLIIYGLKTQGVAGNYVTFLHKKISEICDIIYLYVTLISMQKAADFEHICVL
jgi:hypothetical protein